MTFNNSRQNIFNYFLNKKHLILFILLFIHTTANAATVTFTGSPQSDGGATFTVPTGGMNGGYADSALTLGSLAPNPLNCSGDTLDITVSTSIDVQTVNIAYSVNAAGLTISFMNGATVVTTLGPSIGTGLHTINANRINLIRFTDSCAGGLSNSGALDFETIIYTLSPPNTAPTITGAPASATVTEDVETDVNLSAVTVADSDGDSITLSLSVDTGTIASSDGNGTFSGVTVASSGSASMALAGIATNINTYLDTTTKIKYTTSLNSTTSATLTLTPNDGTTDGTAASTTLNVTPVNDAPSLNTGASPTLSGINEDSGDDDGSGADGDDDASNNANNTGTNIAVMVVDGSITDADGLAVEAIAVTNIDNTNGIWQYTTDNGTSWNNFSGITGSSVDISSAARLLDGTLGGASTQLVRFVPEANHSGTDTLTFKAWDKSSGSAGGTADTTGGSTAFSSSGDTASVVVSVVNDVPAIGNLAGDSINFIQGQSAQLVDQGANASVNDIDSTDFNSGNLTVSIVANADAAEDQLSFDTSGIVSLAGTTAGSNVSVSGTVVGTLGNNIAVGNDLIVNFGANANASRTESLIRTVTYQNTDGASPTTNTRTLRFTVADGDGGISLNNDSSVVVNAADADGNVTASAVVIEPVAIATTIDTVGEAVDVFDFQISDGGTADGLAMGISAVSLQVSGTASDAQRAKVTWRLNGPDAANIAGTYDALNDEIDFTGLSLSIADGASETYTINAYYNDNSGLADGLTYILSVDGDTHFTVSSNTQMGTTSAVNNGTGSTIDVNATTIAFTVQPASSTSGSALGTQPVIAAQDAFGNTDTDFTETITLTEASAGSLTGATVAASSGVATFSGLTYTATQDQQSFTLTANDQDGVGSDISTINSNAVTSDVVATQLVFNTEPSPLSIDSGVATNLTTVPVVSAQDANNVVDTGYSTGIALAEVNGAGSATMSATGDTDGSGATVTITPSAGASSFTSMQINYTASGGFSENFNLQASSGGLSSVNSSLMTAVVDSTPPTISAVSIPNSAHKVGDSVTATIIVTSDADDYTTGSGAITGNINAYTLGSLSKINNTTYSATFTLTDGGADVDAASNVAVNFTVTDSAGNVSAAFNTAISQTADAIYANLPDVDLTASTNTLAEDGGTSTLTATLSNSLNNLWPENITVNLAYTGTASSTSDYTVAASITISAGSSTGSTVVTSVADTIFDATIAETIIVDISTLSEGNEGGTNQQTLSITDAESAPLVTLSVGNASVAENGGTATITATLNTATYANVTVNLGYSGTATSGGTDFNTPSSSITISAGATSANAATGLTAVDDGLGEGDETIVIDIASVSGGSAAESGTQQQTVTIIDDEDTVAPTITAVTIPNSAHKVGDTVTATITVTADTDDYTAGSGSISGNIDGYALGAFAKVNDTTYTATFSLTDGGTDIAAGSNIPLNLTLDDSTGNTSAAFSTAISQAADAIYANVPDVDLTASTNALAEDGGTSTLTATLSNSLNNLWPENITVNLAYTGTASSTSDYTVAASITISAGSSTGSTVVTSVADTIFDATIAETIIVDISTLSEGNEGGTNQQTLSITDAESAPLVTLSVGNASVAENGETASITATLNTATYANVTVNLGYSGTATSGGTDFNTPSSSITISAGATSANAVTGITSVDDGDAEGDETIVIDIASVSGGSAAESGTQQQTVTITDDEVRNVSLSVSTASISEAAAASTITATLDQPTYEDVTVSLGFSGTATSVTDYSKLDTITIPGGNTTGAMILTAVQDATVEPDETIIIDITTVSGGAAIENGSQQQTVTIGDDEEINVSLSATPLSINEAGDVSTLTATLNQATYENVTVTLGYSGTATTISDYTSAGNITVLAGQTSATTTITAAGDDTQVEGPETIIVDIASVTGGRATENAVQQQTLTIIDTNTAAVITSTAVTAATQDSLYSYTLTATDVDTGDTLTLTAPVLPSWLSFNPASGSLSGTPTNNEVGPHNVTLRVNDGSVDTDQVFIITVSNTNDAPTVTSTALLTINEDSAYSYTLTATDVDVGDSLTLSATTIPGWLSFNTSTGALTGTPTNDDVGPHNVTLRVNDGTVDVDQIFVITVANTNDLPVANAQSVTAIEDIASIIVLTATDVDSDPLTYSVVTNPANGSLSGTAPNLLYTPTVDFNGSDSFSFKANDGTADSNTVTVSINIQVDLDGDGDPDITDPDDDGDGMSDVFETANGLDPQDASDASTDLDGDGVSNLDEFIANSDPTQDDYAPAITAPGDMTVDAVGLFTPVDIGVGSSTDALDGDLTPSVIDVTSNGGIAKTQTSNPTHFKPGIHILSWSVTDAANNTATTTQTIRVNPMVNFSKNQATAEGSSVIFTVILNGDAATYPVSVPYTVTGTAATDGSDHDLVDGTVVINSGNSAQVNFNIIDDGAGEGQENIVLTMGTPVNAVSGSNPTHQIDIVEGNLAPVVTIDVNQSGGSSTRTVIQNGGDVEVSTLVVDPNAGDSHGFDWSASDNALVDTDGSDNSFTFDPSGLVAGLYTLRVTVSDGSDSDEADISLNVVTSSPQLTTADSDGDGTDDQTEGFGDSDGDGIADYLDAIQVSNITQEQVGLSSSFLIETEAGLTLKLGQIAFESDNSQAAVSMQDIVNIDGRSDLSTRYAYAGGLFDFSVSGLPVAGQSVSIVLAQLDAIPEKAVYRKLTPQGWQDFVVNANNLITSAPGEQGFCPPPGDTSYQEGLTEGHWCVQLSIEDGGPNDADNTANHKVVDPGGVATELSEDYEIDLRSSGGSLQLNWLMILGLLAALRLWSFSKKEEAL